MSPAIICLTFDNLGEAADLGSGTWPGEVPVGQHFTADVVVRLLELLERLRLPATYFVEAYNASVYPDLLRRFADAGHEIGCHAWQHEAWHRLTADQERESLVRCSEALRALGLDLVGFRPPGGQITDRSEDLLVELGYSYYSPAGQHAGASSSLAVIPFDWRYVDAFFSAAVFSGLRSHYGVPEGVQTPAQLAEAFITELHRRADTEQQMTLLFHPMLLSSEESFAALETVLGTVADLRDRELAAPMRMRDLADRILTDPESWGEPVVEIETWN